METIEQIDEWRRQYADWQNSSGTKAGGEELGDSYPFVKNKRAPFLSRALRFADDKPRGHFLGWRIPGWNRPF